jgi:hypothetical protein
VSTSVAHFDALVAAGAVHEALRFAFDAYEARGRREPGACCVRLRKIALELDARGALDDVTWARVETIVEAARVPLDDRLRALREPRWPRIGVVGFPVVLRGFDPPTGALRWVEATLSSDDPSTPDDPRLVDERAREALRSARETLVRVLPDADVLARRARLRITPDLPSNERIQGGSLAAAALVALASLHLRREVTPTHVVTAELERHRLRPVDDRTLPTKRATTRDWPRITTLVAPGHPTMREGSLTQIGDVERPEELLTLFGLRWWSHVTRDRLRWIDRSWREARNVEEWFFDLAEKNARLTETSPRRVDPRRWVWLAERLRDALDEWTTRFVEGLHAEGLLADAFERSRHGGGEGEVKSLDDHAVDALGETPIVDRGKDLHLLAELRRRARDAIAIRRESLERLLVE